jgi:hypothetical protein
MIMGHAASAKEFGLTEGTFKIETGAPACLPKFEAVRESHYRDLDPACLDLKLNFFRGHLVIPEWEQDPVNELLYKLHNHSGQE